MKESTAAVHAQVPVDVASFLLNEKRLEIQKIELKQRVAVILIPNKQLETPNYKLERLKHDDPRLDSLDVSYKMAEEFEDPTSVTRRSNEPTNKQTPIIKGVLPDAPAPAPVLKPVEAVAPVSVAPRAGSTTAAAVKAIEKPAEKGFFSWIKGFFGGGDAAPVAAAPKAPSTRDRAPSVEGKEGRSGARDGERNERGGRDGRRGERGGRGRNERGAERGERVERGDRPGERAERTERSGAEGREPREGGRGERNGRGRNERGAERGDRAPRQDAIENGASGAESTLPNSQNSLQNEAPDQHPQREPREPRESREGGRRERGGRGRNERGGERSERPDLREQPDGMNAQATLIATGALGAGAAVALSGDAAASDQPSNGDPAQQGERRERRSRDRYGRDRRERGERSERAPQDAVQAESFEQNNAEAPVNTAQDAIESVAFSAPAQIAPQATTAPVAPALATAQAGMPKIGSYSLPVSDMDSVAVGAGLQWINSNPERIAAVKAQIASEPKPLHIPRERPPAIVLDDGPLVLVETKRDLRNMTLPFEQAAQQQQ